MTPPFGAFRRWQGSPDQAGRTSRIPLRERLDVGLFLRRLFGRGGFRLVRLVPRRRLILPKEYWVHGVMLFVVASVVLTNLVATGADRGSLLFALFREGEVEEGPLPAHRDGRGTRRGALLGLIPAASAGGITKGDIEFELANTLAGSALVATGSPETTEASEVRRSELLAYAVQEGDTPGTIAARFGISTNTILWANGIRDGDVIRPGDVLVVLPVSGVLHTVKEGDDVTSLAQRYDAKVEEIIARNGLNTEGAIRIGQKLIVPDGQIRVAPRLAYHPPEPEEEAPAPERPTAEPAPPGVGFVWPGATRAVSQYFGWRHTGIDIRGPHGAPIRAMQGGVVEFSGWLGGYGRLVILRHGNGLTTYYAHLAKSYVGKGEQVARGQVLGANGCTGRCTGPHVHVEVRQHGRPVNPLRYF